MWVLIVPSLFKITNLKPHYDLRSGSADDSYSGYGVCFGDLFVVEVGAAIAGLGGCRIHPPNSPTALTHPGEVI
jgi:hypothetical protein